MTRRKKHKPEQILAKLRDADVILNSGKISQWFYRALALARRLITGGVSSMAE